MKLDQILVLRMPADKVLSVVSNDQVEPASCSPDPDDILTEKLPSDLAYPRFLPMV